MTKYWVVGAAWGGVDYQDQRFVEQGMWMLGWEDGKQPQRAAEMQPGDRIAIKRMKGRGQTGIRILHLGIVKGVILDVNRVICTVNWVADRSRPRHSRKSRLLPVSSRSVRT